MESAGSATAVSTEVGLGPPCGSVGFDFSSASSSRRGQRVDALSRVAARLRAQAPPEPRGARLSGGGFRLPPPSPYLPEVEQTEDIPCVRAHEPRGSRPDPPTQRSGGRNRATRGILVERRERAFDVPEPPADARRKQRSAYPSIGRLWRGGATTLPPRSATRRAICPRDPSSVRAQYPPRCRRALPHTSTREHTGDLQIERSGLLRSIVVNHRSISPLREVDAGSCRSERPRVGSSPTPGRAHWAQASSLTSFLRSKPGPFPRLPLGL